jgi:hypothetical protein
VEWEGMDWTDMTQDGNRWRAVVNAAMNLRLLKNVGNFLTRRKCVSFSGRTLLHGVSHTELINLQVSIIDTYLRQIRSSKCVR